MNDDILAVRQRISIVELVSQRVTLKRAGKHWKGLCPFHQDKNPSFTVTDELGRYKCWSCGEHGDIFTWTMKMNNIEFPDALKLLAAQAGVQLSNHQENSEARSRREKFKAILDDSLSFFRESLQSSKQALAYCHGRDLSDEICQQWELGYSPESEEALALYLRKKGHSLADAKTVFVLAGDANGYRDLYRGRLMFPIRDERGELQGFGGRIMGSGQPKYINSSDTPVFKKSRVLYGLDQCKEALRSDRHLILVEGYLDVIACHRVGIKRAVASLGTSLTEEHALLIQRWADKVTVLYDGDSAGLKASGRALEILSEKGIPVKISLLPKGDDPDSLVRKGDITTLNKTIESSDTPLQFELRQFLATADPQDPLYWSKIVGIIAKAPTEMDENDALEMLVPYLPEGRSNQESLKSLKRDLTALHGPRRNHLPARNRKPQLDFKAQDMNPAEVLVFAAILHEDIRKEAWEALSEDNIFSETAEKLAAKLQATFGFAAPPGPASDWLGMLSDPESEEMLAKVFSDPRSVNVSSAAYVDSLAHLRNLREKRGLEQLRTSGLDDDKRKAYFEKLRELKGNQT